MRGEKQPDKCISRHERAHRDVIMDAVQRKIWRNGFPMSCSEIIVSGRPILSKYRERILRREFENFSPRRSYLIADAVGIHVKVEVAA